MQQDNKNIKILISGGGTGGHIFPAISIANAIKKNNDSIDILFVGATGRMEMEKIPDAGYKIIGIPVMGFPRKPSVKIITFFIKLIKALLKARKIVKEFNPDIAIGVGGYASGPALKMASKQNVPYVIQEQNSYPGITNKLLGKKAKKIFVAYDKMDKYFPPEKIVITGNPIRQDIMNTSIDKEKCFEYFKLDKNKLTLLVTGGSQGALSINNCIFENIEKLIKNDIQVIWQTGKNFINKAEQKLKKLNTEKIFVSDFIYKMDYAYNAANLILARAGASTISELSVVGKPAILIPSPNVSEDHQTKNAMALVEKNAAVIIKDKDVQDKLTNQIIKLIHDDNEMQKLQNNIKKFRKTDAADEIAKCILEIIEKNN